MTWLVTADLHLDSKPQHEYRWGIFDWMAKVQQKHCFSGCLILGDITDEKDCHSASLVNRMVEGLCKLEPPVYILKGNHDYIDRNNPYFGFLNCINGLEFITKPKEIDVRIAAIPHQPDQKSFDEAYKEVLWELEGEDIQMVLLHGLFDGAISETGQRLSGLKCPKFDAPLVLAGDVHAPQQVGQITYVGAPYRVRFGDAYNPRVLHLDGAYNLSDLKYPCPSKISLCIRSANELLSANIRKGDQVKITIELAQEEAVQWAEHKAKTMGVLRELGAEIFGIKLKLPEPRRPREPKQSKQSGFAPTPKAVFEAYCQAEGLKGVLKETGLALLEEK